MQTQCSTTDTVDQLVAKLSRRESPVADLVRQLHAAAAEKGLSLSRWQANAGNYKTTITWMIHTGGRADQARYQPGTTIIDVARLSAWEGTSTRCDAYAALSGLLEAVHNHP